MAEGSDVVRNHVEAGILRQIAEATLERNGPTGSNRFPTDHLQHGGLTGTVSTDKADLLTGAHRERHAVDEGDTTNIDSESTDL